MAGSQGSASKGTTTVKYVGTSDVREIDAASFKRAGVTDQDKVSWSRENDFKAKVSTAAAEFLANESDFEVK